MNSKSSSLVFMAMMGSMMYSSNTVRSSTLNEVVIKKKTPQEVIPNGCKIYFFTRSGEPVECELGLARKSYSVNKPNGYDIIFECFASNKKNAQRKYDKFLAKLPSCKCSNGLEIGNCSVKCERNILGF